MSSSTDTAEETLEVEMCQPKIISRTSKYQHLSAKAKEIIFNTYKNEAERYPTLVLEQVAQIVAEKTGTSKRTVRRINSEYKRTQKFSDPQTNKNRERRINRITDVEKSAIRRIVHEYFFKNQMPSLDMILKKVNCDPDLPHFKRSSFYTFLKSLNFKFIKRGIDSMLLEKEEIVLWRRDYLTKIKAYRDENRKIYYMDETWITDGHTTNPRQTFLDGLLTGLKKPLAEGRSLIVCHIGSNDGFVPGAAWVFESKKTQDYHKEIDEPSFEQWFESTLPKLEDNSVIVLDNAPYHSRTLENIPTIASGKNDIQQWLHSKNIPFEKSLLKTELLSIVEKHKDKYQRYVIDEMAILHNKLVLRIPPYHCELNPIELIWADMKNFVAEKNFTFKLADVKNIFNDAIANITATKWQKYIRHVQETVEKNMWELDNIMKKQTNPIIMNVSNGETSESSDDDL